MTTLEVLLDAALGTFMSVHGTTMGNIQLLDMADSHAMLTLKASRGFDAPFLTKFAQVFADQGCACGRALRTGKTVVISDVETDDDFAPFRSAAREAGYRAVVSTPITASWGHTIGVVSAHYPSPFLPSPEVVLRGEVFCRTLAHDILSLTQPRTATSAFVPELPRITPQSRKTFQARS